jgi:acetyl esterase/lipase
MAIVLIHGGGFTGGGKGVMDEAADSFVKAGWVAFNINYGLTGYPSENNDVYAAIAWVHLHAAAYGADPNAIAVLGASAGGTLAGMVATRGAAHGAAVRAVATWSGPMDIATLVDSTPAKSYAHTQPVIYVGGCLPSACPATYNAVSPLDNVTSKTSPMLLANSSNEGIPLSQAQDMDKALIAAHVPQQLDVVPGKRHATKYESVEMAPTIAFLTKYTQPTASSSTAPANSPTTSASQTTSASPTTSASKSTSASNTTRDLVIGIVAVVVVGFLVLLLSRRSRRRA